MGGDRVGRFCSSESSILRPRGAAGRGHWNAGSDAHGRSERAEGPFAGRACADRAGARRSQRAIRAAVARATQGTRSLPRRARSVFRFVQALSDPNGARVVALITRGGEEICVCCAMARCLSALSQGDAALAAYDGKGISLRTDRTQLCALSVACIRSPYTSSSQTTVPLLPYRSLSDVAWR